MDRDLAFLQDADEEMLGVFVDTMLKKGGLTETLTCSEEYKKYGKRYKQYLPLIEKEYLDFGSNTFITPFIGPNSYKEILRDVAGRFKVDFNQGQSVEDVEERLLENVLVQVVDAMEPEERAQLDELVQKTGEKYGKGKINLPLPLLLATAFRAGGFASYQLTVILVNGIAKAILGRGLTLAGNAALTRALSIFAGPIGIIVMSLWTLFDFAGPAYRVTIPCTILIAAMRREKLLREYREVDKDLLFLQVANQELLGVFIEILCKKGSLTETLTGCAEFENYAGGYRQLAPQAVKEYLAFGTNTVWNIFGAHASYREVLCDVAAQLGVAFNSEQRVEELEGRLLEKVLSQAVNNMSPEERGALLELAQGASKRQGAGEYPVPAAVVEAFRSGGATAYRLVLLMANSLAQEAVGHGLPNIVAYAQLGMIVDPYPFWGLLGYLVGFLRKLTGPAYHITVPCTILIAAMRWEKLLREDEGFRVYSV